MLQCVLFDDSVDCDEEWSVGESLCVGDEKAR